MKKKKKKKKANDKKNLKLNSKSQVKQILNKLIQNNNYHTNLTKLGHEQTKQSQSIKLPETDTELKDKEAENQTKKL